MHDDEKIEDLKNKIRTSYFKENFIESIKHCNALMRLKINEVKWFATYQKSLAYKKLNNIDYALKCAKKSLLFIEDMNDTILNHQFTNTRWLMAACYEEKGNINKALELHEECVEYFKRVDDKRLMAISIFNITKIKNDIDKMEEVINFFINNNLKSTVHLFKEDMDHVTIVKQMIDELYSLDKERAKGFINKLKNEELRINLVKNLVA